MLLDQATTLTIGTLLQVEWRKKKGIHLPFHSRTSDFEKEQKGHVVLLQTHLVTSLRRVRKRQRERERKKANSERIDRDYIQAVCFSWRSPQRGAVQIFVRLSKTNPETVKH